MKAPTLLTRAFGNPVFAVIACGWFINALRGWYLGHSSLLETMLAGGCAVRSLSSWRTLRNHQAWLRQWNDAGTPPASASETPASESRSDRSASKGAVIVSLLLIILLPLAARGIEHDATTNTLAVLAWFACIVWFPVALVKYRRQRGAVSADKPVKPEPPPVVAWVAEPASIAPTRADAIRNLPDYALSATGLERVGR
ncbi:MAG TPA: hypothetical protein VHZ07_20925 [Bryobacteraceae bacterium]|jgi:hypothetical protein|nr:hypothetical protein [Bryobacteraceae bacterium]